MIRGLAILVVLVVGLAGAVIVGGRLSHARALFGDGMPAWTVDLDARAGVLRGHGRVDGAELRWHLANVDWQGPRWHVTVYGPDWQAQGQARLIGEDLQISDLSGLVSGALLEPGGSGLLALAGGRLHLSMPFGWLLDGDARGQAHALTLDGALLNGPVALRGDYGDWREVPAVNP